MNTMTKTYHQLTDVFKMYQERRLSPYHPLIKELVKYEDILNELAETQDDLQYAKDKGNMEEEVEDLVEVVEELEGMKKKQWRHLMESFVVNAHYHPYLGD
jgi:chemotaxis protein histidine kinase CheA